MEVSSQVIMGATLMLAATIAIVLSLVLVLLAKLYCSLLIRRRRCHSQQQEQLPGHAALATALCATSATTIPSHSSVNAPTPSTLSSFYAHGVLHAPRSLLFPTLTSTEIAAKQCDLFEDGLRDAVPTSNHPVYISNPVYNSDATGGAKNRLPNAPFKTPDSCPSCPPSGGSSGADNECDDEIRAWTGQEAANTPPLTPMKDLPAQACSIPLRDAGSLCTGSRSDSNTNHRLPSSSSSGTPCTSPSW